MAFRKSLIEILSDPDRREAFVLDDLQFDAWNKLVGVSGTPGILGTPGIFDVPEDLLGVAKTAEHFCRN